MKKNISIIVFWGALWGIEEATAGQLLHMTALNIGWILWFPLAWFFMNQVRVRTNNPAAVLLTASLSAAIKLVNLFTPVPAQFVICPALSILLEGLAGWAVVRFGHKASKSIFNWNCAGGVALVSLSWRILYLAGILLIPANVVSSYPYAGLPALLKFTLYEGLANAILVFAVILAARWAGAGSKRIAAIRKNLSDRTNATFKNPVPSGILSACVLAMAFAIQFLF